MKEKFLKDYYILKRYLEKVILPNYMIVLERLEETPYERWHKKVCELTEYYGIPGELLFKLLVFGKQRILHKNKYWDINTPADLWNFVNTYKILKRL